MRKRTVKGRIGLAVATAIVVIFLMAPIYWLVIGGFQPSSAIMASPPEFFPTNPTFDNYVTAFVNQEFGRYILNSAIVTICATIVVLGLGIFAAYSLARLPIRGKLPILTALLMISVFPTIAAIAPLYLMLRSIGWLNSYQALIVPYVAFNLPFAIWILRNYFIDIPIEMEESARIDGASPFKIVTSVIIPMALPGIFTAGVFSFAACWTEFLMAVSFNSTIDFRTIPVGTALFSGQYTTPYGQLFAGSTVAILPIAILVLVFRKSVTSGLASGAVKG